MSESDPQVHYSRDPAWCLDPFQPRQPHLLACDDTECRGLTAFYKLSRGVFFFFLTPLHCLSKWMRRTRQGSQGKTISGYPAVVGKNTSRWCEAPVQGLMPPGQVLSIPAKQSRPHRKPQLLWALWRHLSNQIPVGAQTPRTPIPISELQALSWNAPPTPPPATMPYL